MDKRWITVHLRIWAVIAGTMGLATAMGGESQVPLFVSASNALQQGFVRLINHTDAAGTIRIEAIDDSGRKFEPIEIAVEPFQKLHFNSDDLELGNASKGITNGIGGGQGDWRLIVDSVLDIEVLAYVRTADGFLTSIHDLVAGDGQEFRVPIFNPGSNRNQQSRVRLINPHATDVSVTIAGVDDSGDPAAGRVSLTLPAGEARTVDADNLESGDDQLVGRFGDGRGKWELFIAADRAIQAVNLLQSPTGNLTNLSTTTTDRNFFREIGDPETSPPVERAKVNWVGVGGSTIATSENGKEWRVVTEIDKPITQPMSDVAFGNGLWVAVASGRILTSVDGLRWKHVNDDDGIIGIDYRESDFYLLSQVAFADGRWVVAGDNALLTSTDGANWSAVCGTATTYCGDPDKEEPDSGRLPFRDVEYGDGLWIAFAGGRVLESANGLDWQAIREPAQDCNGRLRALASGHRSWHSMGGGVVCVRTASGTWRTLFTPTGGQNYNDAIAYGNGDWIAMTSFLGGIATWRQGADRWAHVEFEIPPRDLLPILLDPLDPIKYTSAEYGDGLWVVGTNVGTYTNTRDLQAADDWRWSEMTIGFAAIANRSLN